MRDDQFDEALARRLRAYEDHLPGADGPASAGRPRSRGVGWAVLAGGGAAALAAGALAFAVFNGALNGPTGGPSTASASPSPSASVVPSEVPSASVTSEPTAPTTSNVPTPGPITGLPDSWTVSAQFTDPEGRYLVTDLVEWSDDLVAVGARWSAPCQGVYGPPPVLAGTVWRSSDGLTWTDVSPVGPNEGEELFVELSLEHALVTSDGSLVVVGESWPDARTGTQPSGFGWETHDGETWNPYVFTGMPAGIHVALMESGARGHVAATRDDAGMAIWHSPDGRQWTKALDIASVADLGAGDEGFAAVVRDEGSDFLEARIIASGDGLTWVDADTPSGEVSAVGAIGPDWLTAGTAFDGDVETENTARTWTSENALTWSEIASLRLGRVGEDPPCLETVGGLEITGPIAILTTGRCGEGGVVTAGSAYGSFDTGGWEPLPFGDYARVSGIARIGDRLVVVTDTLTGNAPEIGVTFWVSELP